LAVNEAVAHLGVRMMVGFKRRFDRNFQKVREAIADGAVGTLLTFSASPAAIQGRRRNPIYARPAAFSSI
jgi:predicted dehydrogenase